jgi:hypothetical protein
MSRLPLKQDNTEVFYVSLAPRTKTYQYSTPQQGESSKTVPLWRLYHLARQPGRQLWSMAVTLGVGDIIIIMLLSVTFPDQEYTHGLP